MILRKSDSGNGLFCSPMRENRDLSLPSETTLTSNGSIEPREFYKKEAIDDCFLILDFASRILVMHLGKELEVHWYRPWEERIYFPRCISSSVNSGLRKESIPKVDVTSC